MYSKRVITLLQDATTTQTGAAKGLTSGVRTIQASISGTGAVSGTVEWYGSNTDSVATGLLLATSSLSGTNQDNTGGAMTAEYFFMWAKVTAISGTGAKITATVSA